LSKIVTIENVKIAFFDPYLNTLGGGEKYMLTAAACLSKKYSVSLFWDDPTILTYAKNRFDLNLDTVTLTSNPFTKKNSFISRFMQTKKYDALFYVSDGSIPVVGSRKLFLHFQFPVPWITGTSFITRQKMKRVTKIICNSFFTKKFIDLTFHKESTVIFPPSSGEYTIQRNIKKENIILSVGRYGLLPDGTTFKKQEFMIKVFKNMIDRGLKNWKFILVVSFPDHTEKIDSLQMLTENYPIDIKINVPSRELNKLYATAKIYWHAAGFGEDLKKHPERAEHFGIATVQAMEQGAIPVVINAGGQTEIVSDGENGLLWKTEEELIKKTISIIENKSLWKKLSDAARKRSIDFSRDIFCKNIVSIMT
jgi:glycosyltransferase involved in cell wall biosynthesis